MSILFCNKRHGFSISCVVIHNIYWAKKNQNCKQPNISSGQIYWVISYHQYISRSRYAGQGENYKEEYKMSETCWANFDKLEETTASLFQKKIHEREKKNAKLVVNENHSLRGTHNGQKYCNGPNQNMPFNILPNKTKKVKNRSKVNNQSGF